MSDDAGETPAETAAQVHEHLRATEELPVERTASRWIGEAEAVAADAASGGLEEAVVRERLGHVHELLENVETTGNEEADDYVERARRLAAAVDSA